MKLFRGIVAAAGIASVAVTLQPARADDALLARGKYLTVLGGCTDCHTPGYFFGKPDSAQYLGGSDVGFEIPGLGAFVGRNITPDKETGIGTWTTEQIIAALQTGRRPDGRVLAPIMPWHALANLTKDDALAIAAFLQSIPPVQRDIPGPFAPGETVPVFMFRILPPGAIAAPMPKQ